MVLLHTLVISVVISIIAVMVLRWVTGRYMLSARNYRSTTTKARAHGYFQNLFPAWFSSGVVPSGTTSIDGKTVSYSVSGTMVTITSDEDQ
jgi:hypothetical protein